MFYSLFSILDFVYVSVHKHRHLCFIYILETANITQPNFFCLSGIIKVILILVCSQNWHISSAYLL